MDVVGEGYAEIQPSIRRIHHEFKNNLQTVCSLIRLFSPSLDAEGKRILKRIEGCVHSMGSMYESLDKTGTDLSRVLIDDYLLTILRKALKSVDCKEATLRPDISHSRLFVESRVACQLGLLFNEIVVHVLAGFLENRRIDSAILDVNEQNGFVRIEVDFGNTVFVRPESTQLSEEKILHALVAQVEAVIEWPWESGRGLVSLVIPKSSLCS